METKWVILANASLAKIYTADKSAQLIHTLEHAESRAKISELVEDKPGHYQKGQAGRGTYSPPHTPKQIEQMHFAKEVVDFLEKNRNEHKFQQIIIITPPHFHGLLMQHMHAPLKNMVTKIIEKDIVDNSEHELKKYIQDILHA